MPELTVVVEQCLAPVPGGTGRYAREITAALAAEPPPGWTIRTVAAWHRNLAPALIPGTDGPHRLPAGRRTLAELWRRGLPPMVRGASVHATTPLAPRRSRGLVVTVHDAVPWTHPETLTSRGVAWHRDIIGRAARRADAIVVPSLAVADDLSGIFPEAAGRMHVVGHGVTALPPPEDAVQRRHRLGLPERYVLAIATLEPRKGLDVLVEAMASRVMGSPVLGLPAAGQVNLVIVGPPGWGSVDIAAVAARSGLAPERVHVTGRLDDTDLAAVLSAAAVLAAPSRSEGFGLPVLEAMAAGVPVVCSDAPALVELAGGIGLVVPRDDPAALAQALANVLGDHRAAAELADRGRRRALDFSWPLAAERLWGLHLAAVT